MTSNISDERNELKEDEEKLRIALHEFDNQWGYEYYSDDEEEEEEDQLLIDLEYQTSEQIGHSNTPSCVGSASQSQSLTAVDEESGDAIPRPNLALPSHIDVIEDKSDPQKTLYLNRILQGILEEHINDIKEALRENKEKQKKLQEDASDYSTKPEKKGVYSGSFRAPYFRHVNSYPPSNEDVVFKKTSGDYEIITVDSIRDLRQFNKGAKQLLRDAVLENYLEQILKPTVVKMELEIQKRDKYTEEFNSTSIKLETETKHLEEMQKGHVDANIEKMIKESKKTVQALKRGLEEKRKAMNEHKQEVERLEKEIQSKRSIPEDEVLKTVDTEKVDWMKIAKQNFGGNSTWLDCQKAWENLVSPAINKKTWTKEDDKKLVAMVKSTNWDWKEVAKAMGNGRTPFQCFSHYQQYFNSDLKPRPWTEEEDTRLVRVTNNVRDSVGFFSWSKVSTLMDSRSPVECMYRFTKVDPLQHRGRWTELEDAKLLAAVEMIGPCWSKVAKFINTRNMVQCRDRYLNCLAPNINFSHFVYEEDVKLLKLYKNFGPAWAKMVPEFVGRTDNMLLGRYRQLKKWKQQNEWFERQSDATKRMLLGKSLTIAERRRYESNAFGYIRDQLGIRSEDYKRQELDKQNGVDPDIIPTRPPRHLRCYTVGGPSKSGALNKWSIKLETHRRLTENLHRLLEKEALASSTKKGQSKAPTTLPEELTEQIWEKTVEETLTGKKTAPHSKGQIKKLEAALNKVFLTAGTVSVQELLKTSVTEKKRTRKTEMNSVIESELKNFLRRRSRSLSKLGRSRRFFDKDTRPANIIEEELDELDHSVPLILMMCLGTNIQYLCNAVRIQCLKAQEELLNLPSYDEDVDFKTEESETQAAIQKMLVRTGITDLYRQQRLRVLRRKLKSLRRLYRERAFLNSRIVQNKLNSFHDDLDYLESLVGDRKEKEIHENFLLMTCSPHVSLDAEFKAEMIEDISSSSNFLSNASTPYLAITSVPPKPSSQQFTSNKTLTHKSLSDGGNSSESSQFAVPLLPPRRKRTRFDTKQPDSCSDNESASKRFKGLSKQDISEERRKIPDVKKTILSRLPYLPPSLSTLLGLRALFLIKSELIEKAGNLYKPEHYGSTPQLDTDTLNKGEGNSAEGNTGHVPINSGSWFTYTNPQQLTEQASSFEGYGIRRRGPAGLTQAGQISALGQEHTLQPQSNEYSHVSFENNQLVIPLEERGGRLPESGTRFGHDSNSEMEPVVISHNEEPVLTTADQVNSGYEIVMGYSGEYTSRKGVEKEQVTSVGKTNIDSIPVVHNSVTIDSDCLIKTDIPVSYNANTRYINSCNDTDRARDNIVSKCLGTASGQIETSNILDVGAISLHPVTQTGGDIDDDDVLAVINFQDEDDYNANSTDTVINICSGQIRNTSGFNSSSNEQIVIFSEGGKDPEICISSQEQNEPPDLGNLELSESRVHHILSNKVLKNRTSQIVLVGVDTDSKTIVHFKSEEDKFKAYEAIPLSIAESNSGNYISLNPSAAKDKPGKPRGIQECMRDIRQSDEYKLLLARFKTLFMWPVLMSTTKPSLPNDGLLPTKLTKVLQKDLQGTKKRQKKKNKRVRPRQSMARREHLRIIRKASLNTRSKKTVEDTTNMVSVNLESTAAGVGGVNERVGKANTASLEHQPEVDQVAAEIGPETSRIEGETSVAGSDTGSEVKRKRGRPVGSKTRKYQSAVLKERPKRAVKNVKEIPQELLDSVKEPVKSLPQWWKDAILAAMLAKKAMADDGEEDTEVNLEDDNDFIDKGNYSDDEWYQQLRQQETMQATHINTDQPCQSTSKALPSEDSVVEETMKD